MRGRRGTLRALAGICLIVIMNDDDDDDDNNNNGRFAFLFLKKMSTGAKMRTVQTNSGL